MKLTLLFTAFIFSFYSKSQTIDTLLTIENHQIHFKIIEGKGTPILFESGAGDDCSIWNSILEPIAKITGATLITYDRAGFGLSTLNSNDTILSNYGILSNLNDLELGLKMLGFDQQIMIVSHSYGGYLSTLYAAKYPERVIAMVLIDVNHNFYYNNDFLLNEAKSNQKEIKNLKQKSLGFFYLASTINETVAILGKTAIPESIPVIDLVNGIPLFKENNKIAYWKKCHELFVENHPNRKGVIAKNCHHYIWFDNPDLVILQIANSYTETLNNNDKIEVYQRALGYSLQLVNKRTVDNK